MVMINGTLQTSTHSAQGVLRCELGIFSVCDERLDSLTSGEYEGFFEVESIQPQLLPSQESTVQLGIVATLKRFSLTVIDQRRKSTVKKQPRSSVAQPQLSLFGEEEIFSESSTEQQSEVELDDGLVVALQEADLNHVESVNPVSANEKSESGEVLDLSLTAETSIEMTAADKALLGERFELSATITLDVTESREKLRQQRDRLKQLGYRFNALEQVWERGE
jgi:hypothetical protein